MVAAIVIKTMVEQQCGGRHVFGGDGSTDDGSHLGSLLQYASANVDRNASHMLLGTSL
jgi:hypothetical protein